MGLNKEELRGLRSDLASLPRAEKQEILAYLEFLKGTIATVDSIVKVELPLALGGIYADRVAWGLKAGPICGAVSQAIGRRDEPRPRCTLLRFDYTDALMYYGYVAERWIESGGLHSLEAHYDLTKGNGYWERAVGIVHRLGDRLATAQ